MLPLLPDGPAHALPGRGLRRRRPSRTELALAGALAATLAALAATLALGGSGSPAASPPEPPPPAATHHASAPQSPPPSTPPPSPASSLTPTGAAAGAFVAELQAGVADGQVSQQAGQDLFNQLQQLLFSSQDQQDQQDPQQVQQQYSHLVQVYDQDQAQGQINDPAASALRQDLQALGTALGAL